VQACRKFLVSLRLSERDWLYPQKRLRFVGVQEMPEGQPKFVEKDGRIDVFVDFEAPNVSLGLKDAELVKAIKAGVKPVSQAAINPLAETVTEATDPLMDFRSFQDISGWTLVSPAIWSPVDTGHAEAKPLFAMNGVLRRGDYPYDDIVPGKTVIFSYAPGARELWFYPVPKDRDGEWTDTLYQRVNPSEDFASCYERYALVESPRAVRSLLRTAPRKFCFLEATTRLHWGEEDFYREIDRRLEQAWPISRAGRSSQAAE